MKAKTKFLKMYYKMPINSRALIHKPFSNPMTLNVIAFEVKNDTALGKKVLIELGFEDS